MTDTTIWLIVDTSGKPRAEAYPDKPSAREACDAINQRIRDRYIHMHGDPCRLRPINLADPAL